jgi:hypothetical protein
MNTTFIGIPCYGGKVGEGVIQSLSYHGERDVIITPLGFSVLTKNFNILYCQALNRRPQVDRFCMHHDDVLAQPGWLTKMLTLMNKHGADILSVAIPIKDKRGLTSTAMDLRSTENPYRIKNLSLRELHEDFEPTFTHPNLLVNSGLMLVNLSRPECEKLVFRFTDEILPDPKQPGKLAAYGVSEDWNFSAQAHALGLKVFCTTEVRVHHVGQYKFDNSNWGE